MSFLNKGDIYVYPCLRLKPLWYHLKMFVYNCLIPCTTIKTSKIICI